MTTSAPNTTSSRNRPWLWIIAAFAGLIAFWAVMLTIAVRRMPASVPLATGPPQADHARH